MMKLLLLSNQGMSDDLVGNPIMLRLRDANLADSRIEEVKMLRCKKPISIRKKIRSYAKECDVVHIHFGGLYALIVWFLLIGIHKPKFITFHGTDIHAKAIKTAKSLIEKFRIYLNQKASFLCIKLYDKCGFVSEELINYVPSYLQIDLQTKSFVQRLGVDYNVFKPLDRYTAQDHLGLPHGKYVLFSDVHNSSIKRRDLAQSIMKLLPDFKLLIMCGVSPNKVPFYINACDFLLLTSDEEGSPNIIRECLSLNKPVFSVDVGDAAQQLDGLTNSRIISRDPSQAVLEINNSLCETYIDNTRESKRHVIDIIICNSKIIDMYYNVINNNSLI